MYLLGGLLCRFYLAFYTFIVNINVVSKIAANGSRLGDVVVFENRQPVTEAE